MSETEFPYLNKHVREDYPLTTEAIDDWFEHCMASRPAITPSYKSKWTRGWTGDDMMSRYPIHPTHEDWVRWFNKWFSQFRVVTKRRKEQ